MTRMTPPGGKDFYRILNVSKTATTHEIKQAYRKLALALHPDRTDGDEHKTHVFKQASEAYNVLSDHSKRSHYDRAIFHHDSSSQQPRPHRRTTVPRRDHYRKVYSPRAPPGFKTFDSKRHWEMHYGDGMMKEEVERARRRAEKASSRKSGYQYESPLGKGFAFQSETDHNPYSKHSRQGPPPRHWDEDVFEYEEAHYYDLGSTDRNNARRVVSRQEYVRERMEERRKNRPPRTSAATPREEEATGCVVM